MGNCQTANCASGLLIQHPNGRMQRMYWSVTAGEVMQMNPGHYVSLLMSLPSSINVQHKFSEDQAVVSFTHVKLLRAHETLDLGRAYRLVTTQEVMSVIRAKKNGNMKRNQHVSRSSLQSKIEKQGSRRVEQETQNFKNHGQKERSANSTITRSKSWRPTLHSISEAVI